MLYSKFQFLNPSLALFDAFSDFVIDFLTITLSLESLLQAGRDAQLWRFEIHTFHNAKEEAEKADKTSLPVLVNYRLCSC